MATRSQLDVQVLKWDAFDPWFRRRWEPGQHVAVVGGTGSGKSTLAVALMQMRKFVLALDPKGGDSTLAKLRRHGFERAPSWPPPPKIRRQIEKGEQTRLIVGPVVREGRDLPKLRRTMAAALDEAFDQGGWTVYIDELQIAADRRLMNLGGSIEKLLIAARDRKVSVVGSFQSPRWVPRSASDQATYLFVYYTRDDDVVNRLAEMAGRPKPEIRGAIRSLPDYGVMCFSRDPRAPLIITMAPEV